MPCDCKLRVLTTGPPGKSPNTTFLSVVLRLLLLEAPVMLFKMQISGPHQVRYSGSIYIFFLLALPVLIKIVVK